MEDEIPADAKQDTFAGPRERFKPYASEIIGSRKQADFDDEGAATPVPPAAKQPDGERTVEYDDEPSLSLRRGDVVQHETFGVGRVADVSGSGNMATAVINFSGRTRHLLLAFAKLKKLG